VDAYSKAAERFLHCAARQFRRDEIEEKAPGRFGRNDRFGWVGLGGWQDQVLLSQKRGRLKAGKIKSGTVRSGGEIPPRRKPTALQEQSRKKKRRLALVGMTGLGREA
jgi:hypothetical protein